MNLQEAVAASEEVVVKNENKEGIANLLFEKSMITYRFIEILNSLKLFSVLIRTKAQFIRTGYSDVILNAYYSIEETKMIFGIRKDFDTFYAFSPTETVVKNIETFRDKFEESFNYLVENFRENDSAEDKFITLDGFADKIDMLVEQMSEKSIFI